MGKNKVGNCLSAKFSVGNISGSQGGGETKSQYKSEKQRQSQKGHSVGQNHEQGHIGQGHHQHHAQLQHLQERQKPQYAHQLQLSSSSFSSTSRAGCSSGNQHLGIPNRRCVMNKSGSALSQQAITNHQYMRQQNTNTSAKSRMNVVTMLTTSVCLFALFTFPIHFARIYTSITQDLHLLGNETLGFIIVANSLAFRCLDSALNPAVILILSPRIRGSLQRLICRWRSDNPAHEPAGVVIRLNQGPQNGTQMITLGNTTRMANTAIANSCSVVSFAPGNSAYNRTSAM